MAHDTAMYVIGSFAGFFLALFTVGVVTRYITPAEFGELGLLLVFAAGLTVFYNLVTLQGTFTWVFGVGEEELDEGDQDEAGAGSKRRALGTGLVTTVLVGAIGTALIAAAAPEVAEILLRDPAAGNLVLIAAASGAFGSIWRLVSNILRLERKPRKFVVLSVIRPVLVLAVAVPLVVSGGGVEGAIAGTAIGSGVAVAIGLLVTRESFRLSLDRRDLFMIFRRGLIYVPIIASFWIAQNVDLLALSRYVPDDEVGLYRLAGRIAAIASYFTAALFMAWNPLRRTATFAAAERDRGREALSGMFLTYFVFGGVGLVLGITVAADTLIRIAPPEYSAGAPLIPLLACGFLAHGLLVAVNRATSFPHKMASYIGSAVVSAVVFLAAAIVLIPSLGAEGAALSVIIGFLSGAALLTYRSQRGPHPIHIEYRRIAAGAALAGGCLALAKGIGPLAGSAQPAVEMAAFLLYPLLLSATGLVSGEERHAIAGVVRQALRLPRRDHELEDRLREIPPSSYAGLELVVVYGWPVSDIASLASTGIPESRERLVAALRRVTGLDGSTEHDAEIGEYLFSDLPVAERDALARNLWAEHVDPEDLHLLERALDGLQRLPKRAWPHPDDSRDSLLTDPEIGTTP